MLDISINKFIYSMRNRIVIGSIFTCSIVALWIFLSPSQYQATTLHQVAAVGGKDVVAVAVLSEKLKIINFFSDSTRNICRLNNGYTSIAINSKVHKIVPSTLIISVAANSPEEASSCLLAYLTDIDRHEDALVQATIDSVKRRVTATRQFTRGMGELSSVETATFTFLSGIKVLDELNSISEVRASQILLGNITIETISKLTQLNFLKLILAAFLGGGLLPLISVLRIRH
jgi:hypothetical protein